MVAEAVVVVAAAWIGVVAAGSPAREAHRDTAIMGAADSREGVGREDSTATILHPKVGVGHSSSLPLARLECTHAGVLLEEARLRSRCILTTCKRIHTTCRHTMEPFSPVEVRPGPARRTCPGPCSTRAHSQVPGPRSGVPSVPWARHWLGKVVAEDGGRAEEEAALGEVGGATAVLDEVAAVAARGSRSRGGSKWHKHKDKDKGPRGGPWRVCSGGNPGMHRKGPSWDPPRLLGRTH